MPDNNTCINRFLSSQKKKHRPSMNDRIVIAYIAVVLHSVTSNEASELSNNTRANYMPGITSKFNAYC